MRLAVEIIIGMEAMVLAIGLPSLVKRVSRLYRSEFVGWRIRWYGLAILSFLYLLIGFAGMYSNSRKQNFGGGYWFCVSIVIVLFCTAHLIIVLRYFKLRHKDKTRGLNDVGPS